MIIQHTQIKGTSKIENVHLTHLLKFISVDASICVFCENFRILQMMAHQKVREKTFLLDETTQVKQALAWKILYDAAEEKRDIVLKMSRAELNSALVRCPIWQNLHKTFGSCGYEI